MTPKKNIPKHRIPELAEKMRNKARTPPIVSLEGLVEGLKQPITEMIQAGYTFEDVAKLLNEEGIDIKASSLKSYYRRSMVRKAVDAVTQEPEEEKAIQEQHQKEEEKTTENKKISPKEEDSSKELSEGKKPSRKQSSLSKFNITDRDSV